jgi:hypothetical protein
VARVARERLATAAVASVAWLAVTGAAARAGILRFDTLPPTMLLALVVMVAGTVILSRSRLGIRLSEALPMAALVGWQGFRLPLELLMHRAYTQGIMPVEMSYTGLNFDIVTGATALIVAALLLAGRAPKALVWAWNVMGSALLLNVLVIALLSAPTPLRVFRDGPPNVWVTQFPFVYLPMVMVATALLGHLLIFRKLVAARRGAVGSPVVAADARVERQPMELA